AQVLKEAGRATALIGADHEARHVDDASTAARLGFDHLERPRRGDEIAAAAIAQLDRFAEARTPFYLQVGFNEPHRLEHPDPARRWTGGSVRPELISNVDVFPTVLEALGLDVPTSVQGRSFAPLLDGRPFEPRAAIFGEMTYHDYYDPRRCVRTVPHHLIVN